MRLELITLPCLSDNFAYLIRDEASGKTALIDAPEATPILAELQKRNWQLDQIWLTHHHDDHIQGVPELVAATGAAVLGAKADAHRLPPLTRALVEDDTISLGATQAQVIDVSGHTIGHIAFYLPQADLVFTADSLMAAGCGRLFEGTPAQMWQSLQKLMRLPPKTQVCSGHDYLDSNLRFAKSIEPTNEMLDARIAKLQEMRANGQLPMPWLLEDELQTNPFLRVRETTIVTQLGIETLADFEAFAQIRALKDRF